MKPFTYARPLSVAEAVKLLSPTARPKAGGQDLLDLAKRGVSTPETMVALDGIGAAADAQFEAIEPLTVSPPGRAKRPGDVRSVGAGCTLARVATELAALSPALADACREAATPQVRNVASIAGNLLQRPRCPYFRDPFFECLKRGGKTCPARDGGVTSEMAIFGNGTCCATHPSNVATALVALDAAAVVADATGKTRSVPVDDAFFVRPEQDPLCEHVLAPGDLIVAFHVPDAPHSAYAEVNQKASFDWASVSCAAVLHVEGGRIRDARIVLGAVAPVPWRAKSAEDALRGKSLSDATAWAAAADAATKGATPLPGNAHKVPQLRAVVRRAIQAAATRVR